MLKKLLSFTLCFNLVVSPVLADDSLNSAFSEMNKPQLTDEEMKAANEFIHKAKEERILKEKCTDGKCNIDNVDKNGSVLGGSIGLMVEQNIGKLYAAIFGGGGMLVSAITSAIGANSGAGGAGAAMGMIGGGKDGGLSTYTVVTDKNGKRISNDKAGAEKDKLKAEGNNKKNMRKGKEVTSEDGETKTETRTDWCAKIAIASEVTAAIDQMIKQKKVENLPMKQGDEQRSALEKLKMTHIIRQQTSTIQAVGFAGVASCYGVQMLTNKAMVVDQMMIIKMAAAASLGTLFYAKAKKHHKAKEEINRIIAAMPRDGACNPYTDTVCFCAEVTSEKAYPTEYGKVCVPSEYGKVANSNSMTCLVINKEGKYITDTACKCKQTNSCFKANLGILNPKFSLATNLMGQGQTALDAVFSGNFDEGKLNSAYLSNSALNNRVLKAADSKVKPTAVSNANKKLASELSQSLAPNIASQLASTSGNLLPPSAPAPVPLPSNISPATEEMLNNVSKKVSYGEAGQGFGGSNTASEELTLPSFQVGEQPQQAGVEVISFAEQAVENADISKAPETPIFDIISYRYRQSAWNKVEIKTEDAAPAAETKP